MIKFLCSIIDYFNANAISTYLQTNVEIPQVINILIFIFMCKAFSHFLQC